MARKRKDGCSDCVDEIWAVDHDDGDDPRMVVIDRNEMMKLTKVAKSWEFTCTFCFKKFHSAQAMGGHQNAHRSERLEEKRLFVRDPIGYRKRAFLRAIKADESSSSAAAAAIEGGSSSFKYVHAAAEMVRNETAGFNGSDPPKRRGGMNAAAAAAGCFYQRWSCKESSSSSVNGEIVVTNSSSKLLTPNELSLVESVRDYEKEKACNDINLDHNLDLTLKL